MPLDGGLVLRGATPADVGQIGELLAARGEANDAEDLELVLGDPDAGFGGTAVVVDGTAVVSTLTLLDETVHVGDVSLPAGQVELVATDREYEGRGLVRALMAWLHGESARRGHLVELVVGIPFFYRQLGFEYGLPLARDLPVVGPLPAVRTGCSSDRRRSTTCRPWRHCRTPRSAPARCGCRTHRRAGAGSWRGAARSSGWCEDQGGAVVRRGGPTRACASASLRLDRGGRAGAGAARRRPGRRGRRGQGAAGHTRR